MHSPDAETAYLFRHALIRDAAYDLQLPATRGQLHGLALRIIEAVYPDLERDSIAAELAIHARFAQEPAAELAYTWRAARFARAKHDPDALHWLEAAARLETEPVRRADALIQAGDLLLQSGQSEQGRPRMHQALDIARAVGDRKLEGAIVQKLGVVDMVRGRLDEAEARFQDALAMARQCGDSDTQGMALTNLATIKRARGLKKEAFELQQQALEVYRGAGSLRGESVALGNIAVYLFDSGEPQQAVDCAEQAAELALRVGNRRTYGIVRGNIGMMLTSLRRLPEAAESFRQALATHSEVYNRPYEAYDRCRYSLVLLALGDVDNARAQWRRGHEQMLAYGDAPDLDEALAEMRHTCAQAGVPPFDGDV